MTTERERIDRMLAEGKVSAEEAQRLRAALEKAEGEEAQAPAGAGREIARPRLSRLAVAGAVALPVAAGLFLTAFGFGVALGTSYERAAAGGAVAAAASLVTALVLGASALVAIRRTPAELRGRGLAWLGVLAPLLLATAAAIAVPRVIEHRRHRAAEREVKALAAAFAGFALGMGEAKTGAQAGRELMATMARFTGSLDPVGLRECRAFGGILAGALDALDRGDIEELEKASTSVAVISERLKGSHPDSIVGKKAYRFVKGKGLVFAGATFAPDLMTGEVTLKVAGDGAKGIVLPLVNREGKWYFSAEPVRFLGGETDAARKDATGAVEPEGAAQ